MNGTARYWRWQVTRCKPRERALRLPGAAAAWLRYVREDEHAVQPKISALDDEPGDEAAYVIGRDRAFEIAIEHLTRGLRARLVVKRGWPLGAIVPAGGDSRAVWRIAVPDDEMRVGATRFIIIDAETGEVIADQRVGE